MNFFRRLIDSNDPASIKRFTILIALAIFAVTAFMALFIMKTTSPNLALVDKIIDDCMIIIGVGIFGVGVEYWGGMLLERAKAAAAAQILTPQPTVTQVDNVEGDIKGGNTPAKEGVEGDPAHEMSDVKKDLVNSLKPKKEIIG